MLEALIRKTDYSTSQYVVFDSTQNVLAMLYLKTVTFVSFYILAWFRACLACSKTRFTEFPKTVILRTLKGRRLAIEEDTGFQFYHEVFTELQCLDICLRTEQCDSVDVREGYSKKTCRINRVTKNHTRLIRDENWSHLDISAQYLREVSV